MAVCSVAAAAVQPPPAPPLPPPRLSEPGAPQRPDDAPGPETPKPPSSIDACLVVLAATGATAETAPQPTPSRRGCQIDVPVRLTALPDPSAKGRLIRIVDRPVVACRLAVAFAGWTAIVAADLSSRRGAAVKAIRTGPGHECRGRNRQPGAKLSAHAGGLALDVAGFDFSDGSSLAVAGSGQNAGLTAARVTACSLFTTVLGPGSDRFHSDHLHLDLQPHGRGGRFRICQ